MPVFLDPAKNHAEPGFLFNPPNERAFRLSASALSDTLKRFGIQEMDFAWWDEPLPITTPEDFLAKPSRKR